MRRVFQFGVAAFILALLTHTWLVQGVVEPLVVNGGSMAPTFLGAHRHTVCRDCAFAFDCGEESVPSSLVGLCPNCGAENSLDDSAARPGSRLVVDRTAFAVGLPRRGDVVVLDVPASQQELCVKRVAGLPGETIEIRSGDLLVDGQRVHRSLQQILATAIVVHDDRYRPKSGAGPRWKPERDDSRWHQADAGYEISWNAPGEANQNSDQHALTVAESCPTLPQPSAGETGDDRQPAIDWLVYQHEQAIARRIGPILDDLAYNQNESRNLVAVPDVVLQCRVELSATGVLWLCVDDGRRDFCIRLDMPDGSGQLSDRQGQLAAFDFHSGRLNSNLQFVLALVDGQLQLACDGNLLVSYRYDPAGQANRPTAWPVAVGGQGSSMHVSELRVLRDVYYLPAGDSRGSTRRTLCDGEYWLLGDNSAVSTDSRTWPSSEPVLVSSLLGKVIGLPHGR